jgi:hypothetical protein
VTASPEALQQVPRLRLVVVLYRTPLRTTRALLRQVSNSAIPGPVLLSVAINRDREEPTRLRRRLRLQEGLTIEVTTLSNHGGVAGAYRHAIADSRRDDVLLLLDADSSPSSDYLRHVSCLRGNAESKVEFTCPDLRAGGMRVSPYWLDGIVPRVWPADRALPSPLQLGHPWGVVNAGLAGTAGAFASVDGFDLRIGLDMSDVAWSIAAGKKGATCTVHPTPQAHALSMRSGGFSTERAKRYVAAIWRMAVAHRDPLGLARLIVRGLHAWLRRRKASDGA